MKHLLIALFAGVIGTSLVVEDAEAARRLGGGGNSGMQRSAPAKRDVQPNQNATPQQAQPRQQPAAGNRWLAPIAGLAAGIGLAALFSYLGLGEELATFLMLALIALAVFFVVRLLLQRFRPQQRPLLYAGAAGAERMHYQAPTLGESAASRSVASEPRLNVPADFDADSFIRHAKLNFVRLQAANDAKDVDDIRQFTTPEMFAEITLQLQERDSAPQKTEVVALDAELLDFATEFRQHIASVRFHGTMRETAGGTPEPFDEIWHITKPVDGERNWAIAGIQQAH